MYHADHAYRHDTYKHFLYSAVTETVIYNNMHEKKNCEVHITHEITTCWLINTTMCQI